MQITSIKAWAPILVAIISLAGTVIVAYSQTYKAETSSLQTIIDQINDKVIPKLQDTIDRLSIELASIRERVARLEGRVEARAMRPEPKPMAYELPKIGLEGQQRLMGVIK